MIALEDVAARRRPLALSKLSRIWAAGSHAVLGSRGDGGPLLLALVAGLARPRSGRVRVLDGAPTDAAVRRQIAFVALEPALPEAMRVREVLALAAAVRKEPPREVAERLAALGVETLADRKVASLSRPEARAVALAEAVTSSVVRVILVEEPLVTMDPRAAGRVSEALRGRGRDGCAVVVTTASLRDAGELADDWVGLRGGTFAGEAACVDTLVEASADGANLRVVLRHAGEVPALVAALAQESDVDAIERDEGSVRLRGRDATALARAAGRAAVEADVDIAELRIDGPQAAGSRSGSPTAGAGGTR
ncbi:MAG TPA: ATP-binding cassette domain-containing protein [Polyangiaceae bacterium]|nr:ATP-binding cassette domain-containing protein [Polyangiaceae bacterium]